MYVLGLISRSATFDLLAVWAVAFVLGRLISQVVEPEWIYGAFGVFGAVAGAGALLEFVTGRNVFVRYLGNNTGLYTLWGVLQARGSVIRAEGAFGHSIALGITLGVSVCLVLGSRFRPSVKTALALLAAAGSVVSFSRSGILTALLAVVLMCLFLRGTLSRTFRVVVLLGVAVAAAVAVRPILAVFASSDEAGGSALYRGELLGLVRSMRPLGLTGDFSVTTTNQASIGSFGSVDNALLLFGLLYGWVPLLAVLAAAVGGVVLVLRRRATPATIAVVAQLPALFTVALITQYAAVAWFTAGLAVGTQALVRAAPSPRTSRRSCTRRRPTRKRSCLALHPPPEVSSPSARSAPCWSAAGRSSSSSRCSSGPRPSRSRPASLPPTRRPRRSTSPSRRDDRPPSSPSARTTCRRRWRRTGSWPRRPRSSTPSSTARGSTPPRASWRATSP